MDHVYHQNRVFPYFNIDVWRESLNNPLIWNSIVLWVFGWCWSSLERVFVMCWITITFNSVSQLYAIISGFCKYYITLHFHLLFDIVSLHFPSICPCIRPIFLSWKIIYIVYWIEQRRKIRVFLINLLIAWKPETKVEPQWQLSSHLYFKPSLLELTCFAQSLSHHEVMPWRFFRFSLIK